jgi:hypothetical protein
MKKLRLVDLLLLVADKKLKDGQMVLIDNDSYKFNMDEERFYTQDYYYRLIQTWDMNLTCYILEDYVEESDLNETN